MLKLPSLRRRLLLQYLLTVGLLLAVAEGALYGLSRWAGERELDTILRREVEIIAAAVELEHEHVEIEGRDVFDRVQPDSRASAWQVLLEDGRTLDRSKNVKEAGDLPAPGGDGLPVEELRIADAEYSDWGKVRVARLLTVRQRLVKKKRRPYVPEQMTFDIRAVVDRSALDEQLSRLAWFLAGGFPVVLGLAGIGGVYLIRRAVRPVERAFDRERRFTGAASHELRTPLTALRGEIDVTLRRERTPAEYAETLRRMDALVKRMTGLVEGLLILARGSAGHLLVGAAEVSVATLRAAVEEIIRLLPGRERVTLICTAPEDRKMLGDGLLLALAVRNLVENALVHGAGSTVQVRIDADASGDLRLTITDQGPGIPAEILANFRGQPADSRLAARSNGRTGLGLSIAGAVVESHGGRLVLENQPDAGSRVAITLPGIRPARS